MQIKIRRICVPSDFSRAAEHAIHYGAALAHEHGAELYLFHVLQDFENAILHPDFTSSGEQARAFFNELEQTGEAGEADESTVTPPPILVSVKEATHQQFDSLKEKWWEGLTIHRAMRYGQPAEEICRYASAQEIDLLVMGTHGRTGLKHLILGSVAERVVRMSPCPVLTVRHPEHDFLLAD